MTCNYTLKYCSRNENISVHYERQHNTRQTQVQVLHVSYTYSTKSMQSITYSGTRVFNTVPVKIRRREHFVTFNFSQKAHILSKSGG